MASPLVESLCSTLVEPSELAEHFLATYHSAAFSLVSLVTVLLGVAGAAWQLVVMRRAKTPAAPPRVGVLWTLGQHIVRNLATAGLSAVRSSVRLGGAVWADVWRDEDEDEDEVDDEDEEVLYDESTGLVVFASDGKPVPLSPPNCPPPASLRKKWARMPPRPALSTLLVGHKDVKPLAATMPGLLMPPATKQPASLPANQQQKQAALTSGRQRSDSASVEVEDGQAPAALKAISEEPRPSSGQEAAGRGSGLRTWTEVVTPLGAAGVASVRRAAPVRSGGAGVAQAEAPAIADLDRESLEAELQRLRTQVQRLRIENAELESALGE